MKTLMFSYTNIQAFLTLSFLNTIFSEIYLEISNKKCVKKINKYGVNIYQC